MNTLVAPGRLRLRPMSRRISLTWILLGAFASMKVSIGGEIYLGEVLASVMLPLWLFKGRLNRHLVWILVIALMWSGGQFLSDLVNGTDPNSMLKGVFAPIVFAATLVSLSLFFERNSRHIASFLIGAALTPLCYAFLSPDAFQVDEPWKFGYGPPVLTLMLIGLSFLGRRRTLTMALAVLTFSVVCVIFSARSLAMFPMVGLAVYLFWRFPVFRRFKRWLRGRAAPLKLAALVVVPIMAANVALTAFFASGIIDPYVRPEVAQKYRQQASSEVGLLLAGRSESLVSVQAYLDAPWLGHGSWAQDHSGYNVRYAVLRYMYGISDDTRLEEDSTLIPAHSYILGAMVWSGVFGGLFWLLYTYDLLGRYLAFARQLPIYFHAGIVSFAWNLFFSPFGADARWALAVFAAALFAWCSLLRRSTQ